MPNKECRIRKWETTSARDRRDDVSRTGLRFNTSPNVLSLSVPIQKLDQRRRIQKDLDFFGDGDLLDQVTQNGIGARTDRQVIEGVETFGVTGFDLTENSM